MIQTLTFLSEPTEASHLELPLGMTEGLVTGELLEAYLGKLIIKEREDSYYALHFNAQEQVWEPVHWADNLAEIRPVASDANSIEYAKQFAGVVADISGSTESNFVNESVYQAKMHLRDVLKHTSQHEPMRVSNYVLCMAGETVCKYTGPWLGRLEDDSEHYFTGLSDKEIRALSQHLWAQELAADSDQD